MNTRHHDTASHRNDRLPHKPTAKDSRLSRQEHFRARFRDASYYSTGRAWIDYAPAYQYGDTASKRYRGQRYEEIEPMLEQGWADAKGASRLVWVEARGAVRDAWCAACEAAAGERRA